MIQPDRLKELEKVYCVFKDNGEITETHITDEYINNCDWYEDLFETKEEAEWYLEFGNITREEKLVLPTWEEAQKEKFCFAKGFDSLYGFKLFVFINKFTNDFEVSFFHGYKTNDYCIEKHFDLRDKEQYIKGCRLCKQLFLGEKV